jgi:hypothetical protein
MNDMNEVKTLLTIDFDADQEGAQPFWYTKRSEVGKGMEPASLDLTAGSMMTVVVRGRALKPPTLRDFKVVEFVLVSQPQIDICDGEYVTFSLPSPIGDQNQACHAVAWTDGPRPPAEGEDHDDKVEKWLKNPMKIGQTNGRWMLRVMLTVAIQRGTGTVSSKRVFSFDVWTNVVGGKGAAETA